MNQLFSIQQLQPLGAFNASGYAPTVYRVANWLRAAAGRPDLIAVIGFCAIGLIVTLAALARSPGFVAAIAQIDVVR
jgi:dienelactone hydrolase